MFDRSNYDVLSIQMPALGMNQNVSPETLDLNHAYYLENIIPQPLGEGRVRYGTEKLAEITISQEHVSSKIIGAFPYVTKEGDNQLLLYVTELEKDATAKDFEIDPGENENYDEFSFTTDVPEKYVADLRIKIEYEYQGKFAFIDNISVVNCNNENKTVTITCDKNFFPEEAEEEEEEEEENPPKITSIFFAVGKIYLFDSDEDELSNDGNPLKSDLSAVCIPRHVHFADKLFICNGADRVKQWDGENLTDLKQTIEEVDYYPPKFRFMFAMHNRIWALGEGAASADYANPDQAMRVYFMYKKGATLDFFNPDTKQVPNINLAETHGTYDVLEAISYVNGYMLFIGREKTQAWTGSEPAGAVLDENKPVLKHETTINEGAVHGDLVLSVGNDVFMVSRKGLVSFSTLSDSSKQLTANSYTAVDPLIRQYAADAVSSNLNYLECRSFRYDNASLAGFKIGFNNVLCGLCSTSLYSWTLFSGNFKEASAYCSTQNRLYLLIDNAIYRYGDGFFSNFEGDLPVYADDDNKTPVYFFWTLPILKFEKKPFMNIFYDVTLSYPSTFYVDKSNKIELIISGDLPQSFTVANSYRFELRGDIFCSIPFTEVEYPEEPDAADIGWRLDQEYRVIQDKLKFVASKFWVTIKGQANTGVVSIKGLNFYGIIERKK